jgi:hypothetical protein
MRKHDFSKTMRGVSLHMKTTFVKAMFILCGLVAGAAAVHAESISVKVPFAFAAGSKTFPAGEYTMEATEGVLMIRGASTPSLFVKVLPDISAKAAKPGATFGRSSSVPTLEGVNLFTGVTYTILPSARGTLSATPLSVPAALTRH